MGSLWAHMDASYRVYGVNIAVFDQPLKLKLIGDNPGKEVNFTQLHGNRTYFVIAS